MKQKQDKQKVTVVIPVETVEHLKKLAEQHQRSFNKELVWGLQRYIEMQKDKK